MNGLLEGKALLVTGVVTTDSIAFATAEAAIEHGAVVILTAPPRDLDRARAATESLEAPLLRLDVTDPADWAAVADHLETTGTRLAGALHAVAYAPAEALDGEFLPPPSRRLDLALETSVVSYGWLAQLVAEHADPNGASVVGLTFDASRAWPTYNWMGVLKAALESANRYVARDVGRRGVRSNLVAAGPLQTRAASAIAGFDRLLAEWCTTPIRWDPADARPVADVACFLFSDLARAVTGEIVHVDAGHHALV